MTQVTDFKEYIVEQDKFAGVTIDLSHLKHAQTDICAKLKAVIHWCEANNKRLIWCTLHLEQSELIPVLTELGFVFHNCSESQLTLIFRIEKNAYAPFVPTHTVGAGGLVIFDDKVLLIKERLNPQFGYKLPGGHVEVDERIEDAVLREVFEETGVNCQFVSLVGQLHKYPYRFDKANLYFVCHLHAQSQTINITDLDEIEDAQWFGIDQIAQSDLIGERNKQLLLACIGKAGLKAVDDKTINSRKCVQYELFFADK